MSYTPKHTHSALVCLRMELLLTFQVLRTRSARQGSRIRCWGVKGSVVSGFALCPCAQRAHMPRRLHLGTWRSIREAVGFRVLVLRLHVLRYNVRDCLVSGAGFADLTSKVRSETSSRHSSKNLSLEEQRLGRHAMKDLWPSSSSPSESSGSSHL